VRDCYLHDCVGKNAAELTSFLCLKKDAPRLLAHRDRMFQAVMSLAIPASLDETSDLVDILDCDAVRALIAYFGAGLDYQHTGSFDLVRLRYHHNIIAFADEEEGREFASNVLAVIHLCLSPLIENKHVFVATLPSSGDEHLIARTVEAAVPAVLGGTVAETISLSFARLG